MFDLFRAKKWFFAIFSKNRNLQQTLMPKMDSLSHFHSRMYNFTYITIKVEKLWHFYIFQHFWVDTNLKKAKFSYCRFFIFKNAHSFRSNCEQHNTIHLLKYFYFTGVKSMTWRAGEQTCYRDDVRNKNIVSN